MFERPQSPPEAALGTGPPEARGPFATTGEGGPAGGPQDGLTDAEVAAYIAKRGFVWSAWAGAAVLTFSYAQLYWAFLAKVYDAQAALAVGFATAILGGVMFLRSRRTWQGLGGDVAHRSMTSALIVAGAGGVFWLLFLLLAILVAAGVAIQ